MQAEPGFDAIAVLRQNLLRFGRILQAIRNMHPANQMRLLVQAARRAFRRREFLNQFLQHGLRLLVLNLACSGVRVAAAAVLQHQFSDIRPRRAVQDGFAHRKHGVLLLHAP